MESDNQPGIVGKRRNCETINNPTWSQVAILFNVLDGFDCTELTIEYSDGNRMAIAGGGDGYYVSVIGDSLGPYDLIGPNQTDEATIVITGEVESHLPSRLISTYNQAILATEYFYRHGSIHPALN